MSGTKDDVKELMETLKEKSDLGIKTDHDFSLDDTELPVSASLKSERDVRRSRKRAFQSGDCFYSYLKWKRVKGKIKVRGDRKLKFIYTINVDIKFDKDHYIDELELTTQTPIETLNTKRILRNLLKDVYNIPIDQKVKGHASYTDKNNKHEVYDFLKDKLTESKKSAA